MKQINNRELLYSTGNYSQCLVITHNGKESEKEYMCVCITDYIAIHPKLTQHCKLAVVQLKKNWFKKQRLFDRTRAVKKEKVSLRPNSGEKENRKIICQWISARLRRY